MANLHEHELTVLVVDALHLAVEDEEPHPVGGAVVHRLQTFDEAAVMTRDAGVVVTMSDGSEYQITVKQSRGPKAAGG